jgi:hypothetical protein
MDLYQTYDVWEKEEDNYKLFLLTKNYDEFILLCQMFMGTLVYIYFYNLNFQRLTFILSRFNKTTLFLIVNKPCINHKYIVKNI